MKSRTFTQKQKRSAPPVSARAIRPGTSAQVFSFTRLCTHVIAGTECPTHRVRLTPAQPLKCHRLHSSDEIEVSGTQHNSFI